MLLWCNAWFINYSTTTPWIGKPKEMLVWAFWEHSNLVTDDLNMDEDDHFPLKIVKRRCLWTTHDWTRTDLCPSWLRKVSAACPTGSISRSWMRSFANKDIGVKNQDHVYANCKVDEVQRERQPLAHHVVNKPYFFRPVTGTLRLSKPMLPMRMLDWRCDFRQSIYCWHSRTL